MNLVFLRRKVINYEKNNNSFTFYFDVTRHFVGGNFHPNNRKDVKLMKSPYPYYGGKSQLAARISQEAPQKFDLYCEPFFGSGAVFFYRHKWAKIEIINDLNGDVVNFFRVLRDKPKKLIDALQLTPHARQEMRESTKFIKSSKSEITRALYFFVRASQSFSANMRENGGWSLPTVRNKKTKKWIKATDPKTLYEIANRLREVAIENNSALQVMKLYDDPKAFYYLDPPYLSVNSARDKNTAYQGYDMQEGQHQEFINACLGMKSKMIISGYDHPIYKQLTENGWRRIEIKVHASSGNMTQSTKSTQRLEILWLSPNIPIPQKTLF